MRPKRVTQTNAGSTNVIPLNHRSANFKVGIFCKVVSGAPTYTVELTGDDVQDPDYSAASGNWFNHSYLAALTTDATGHIEFPTPALRLTVTGTGVVQMTVVSAGH